MTVFQGLGLISGLDQGVQRQGFGRVRADPDNNTFLKMDMKTNFCFDLHSNFLLANLVIKEDRPLWKVVLSRVGLGEPLARVWEKKPQS